MTENLTDHNSIVVHLIRVVCLIFTVSIITEIGSLWPYPTSRSDACGIYKGKTKLKTYFEMFSKYRTCRVKRIVLRTSFLVKYTKTILNILKNNKPIEVIL